MRLTGQSVPPSTRPPSGKDARQGRLRSLFRSPPPVPGFTPREEDIVAHWVSRVPPVLLLALSGLGTVLLYLSLVLAYPITRWWNHPRLAIEMGKLTNYSPVAAFSFVGTILGLFLFQFFALTAIRHIRRAPMTEQTRRVVMLLVFGLPVLFAAIMLWMQPITTTDLYGYVARGYLFTHLHKNPMIFPAQKLPGGYLVDRPASPYGPLWLLIVGVVARVCGENLLANMIVLKLISIGAYLGTLGGVDQLAMRIVPNRRLSVAVLFAWSPLLIFEAIGNGHNDIVMMLCIVVAFVLMERGWLRSALMLLVLGALLKYVAFALIPFWLVYALRTKGRQPAGHVPRGVMRAVFLWGQSQREWIRQTVYALTTIRLRWTVALLAISAVLGGAVIAAAYAPFWVGLRTFTGLGEQLRPLYYTGSIVQFIAAPLQLMVKPSEYSALDKSVRLAFYLLFFTYAVMQTVRLWRALHEPSIEAVITASAKVVFAALVLITFWFQPWYIVWLLPLSALSKDDFLKRAAVIFSAGALLTYAVSNFLPVGSSGIGRDLFVQFFEVLVTFAPLLMLRPSASGDGWVRLWRRYAQSLFDLVRLKARTWEYVTLALILVVAGLLRVLRLGDLFDSQTTNGGASDALGQVNAHLKLYLADPRGLHEPIALVDSLFTALLGASPMAVLLPTAIVGTLTVYAIYLLTFEITRLLRPDGIRAIALLAALLAATSRWHVSLSRSGMEIVVLTLVRVLALYFLFVALRWTAEERRAAAWMAIAAGVFTGLAMDITPGLWLSPLLALSLLVVWWTRQPKPVKLSLPLLGGFGAAALLAGLPAIVNRIDALVGVISRRDIPDGSDGVVGENVLSLSFWQHFGQTAIDVLKLFASQDYTASYPSPGGAPVVSLLISWCFFVGLLLLLITWRTPAAQVLLLLVALPLLASISMGSVDGTILAAGVLPAMCIVPALFIYRVGEFLGHLPIVLDRVNGARVFTTPEQIGRLFLFLFLLVMTVRTFFWYFQAMLPSTPPNQWIPT